jgi:hypothetical protein
MDSSILTWNNISFKITGRLNWPSRHPSQHDNLTNMGKSIADRPLNQFFNGQAISDSDAKYASNFLMVEENRATSSIHGSDEDLR